jgi:hypothetical protein
LTDAEIADRLNGEGQATAKGKAFTAKMVQWIRWSHRIPRARLRRPEELTVQHVAKQFGVNATAPDRLRSASLARTCGRRAATYRLFRDAVRRGHGNRPVLDGLLPPGGELLEKLLQVVAQPVLLGGRDLRRLLRQHQLAVPLHLKQLAALHSQAVAQGLEVLFLLL